MVSLLVEAGCWGVADFCQPIDAPDLCGIILPAELPDRLAYHRSFPHGGKWPSIPDHVAQLRAAGYAVTVISMVRQQLAVERSQVKRGHCQSIKQARQRIRRAQWEIMRGIVAANVDSLLVPFSQLGCMEYRAWLAERLRLPVVPQTPWRDENAKHLGGG